MNPYRARWRRPIPPPPIDPGPPKTLEEPIEPVALAVLVTLPALALIVSLMIAR